MWYFVLLGFLEKQKVHRIVIKTAPLSQFLHASTCYSKVETINENHSSYNLKNPLLCKITVATILQIGKTFKKNGLKNKNIPHKRLPNIIFFYTQRTIFSLSNHQTNNIMKEDQVSGDMEINSNLFLFCDCYSYSKNICAKFHKKILKSSPENREH